MSARDRIDGLKVEYVKTWLDKNGWKFGRDAGGNKGIVSPCGQWSVACYWLKPEELHTAVEHIAECIERDIDDLVREMKSIDEPWQDRPEPGDWWVSIRPELRKGFPSVVPCIVFKWADKGGLFVRYSDGGDYLELAQDWFAGAKWQRRTTPTDPFAKEKVQP